MIISHLFFMKIYQFQWKIMISECFLRILGVYLIPPKLCAGIVWPAELECDRDRIAINNVLSMSSRKNFSAHSHLLKN